MCLVKYTVCPLYPLLYQDNKSFWCCFLLQLSIALQLILCKLSGGWNAWQSLGENLINYLFPILYFTHLGVHPLIYKYPIVFLTWLIRYYIEWFQVKLVHFFPLPTLLILRIFFRVSTWCMQPMKTQLQLISFWYFFANPQFSWNAFWHMPLILWLVSLWSTVPPWEGVGSICWRDPIL